MEHERDEQKQDKPAGNTIPVLGEEQQPAPRQPHERDQSADSQKAGEPSGKRMGALAHRDIEQGRVDTDKGPVLDATYDKLREGASQPEKRFRR